MIILPPIEWVDAPTQIYDVTIDGSAYVMEYVFRERQEQWYLTVYAADHRSILSGKALSVDTSLTASYVMPWDGHLVLLDLSMSGKRCGYRDLGERCVMAYISPADVPAGTVYDVTVTV